MPYFFSFYTVSHHIYLCLEKSLNDEERGGNCLFTSSCLNVATGLDYAVVGVMEANDEDYEVVWSRLKSHELSQVKSFEFAQVDLGSF